MEYGPFDAGPERHGQHGARPARAQETYFRDTGREIDADQFDTAAIDKKIRTNMFERAPDAPLYTRQHIGFYCNRFCLDLHVYLQEFYISICTGVCSGA